MRYVFLLCVIIMTLLTQSDCQALQQTQTAQIEQQNSNVDQQKPGVDVMYQGEKVGKLVDSNGSPQMMSRSPYQCDPPFQTVDPTIYHTNCSKGALVHFQIQFSFKNGEISNISTFTS